MLSEFELHYMPQKSIKGRADSDFLADLLIETNDKNILTCLMKKSSRLKKIYERCTSIGLPTIKDFG